MWYDTLYASTRIIPPTDVPPTLSMFPDFVQEYVKDYNLSIYGNLSSRKTIPESMKHELNEQEFDVRVSNENINMLKKLGVISEVMGEGTVPVKLKYIDPIYALTNDPQLFEDPVFRQLKAEYIDSLTIVHDSLDEPTGELRRHGPEGEPR